MSIRMLVLIGGGVALIASAIALVVLTHASTPTPARPSTPAPAIATTTPRAPSEPPPRVALPLPSVGDPDDPAAAAKSIASDVDPSPPPSDDGSAAATIDQLNAAFAEHRFADAFAYCGNAQLRRLGASECAISACEVHDPIRAHRWLGNVSPADRAEVIATCAAAHAPINQPPHPFLGGRGRFTPQAADR